MKKTSRLATLGELGQYPMWCKVLQLSLKYEWSLNNRKNDGTLMSSALIEMAELAKNGVDCWVFRIDKIKTLLNIQPFHRAIKSKKATSAIAKSKLQVVF